jgi:threonine dehydratase
MPVTIEDVRAAAARIQGQVVRTPLAKAHTLSQLLGCELWLKYETQQFTASFKERGALNKLLLLTEDERRRGVIAMSAGNHAQGVAYNAARLGIACTIVMPKGTPYGKVRNTETLGAQVVLAGETIEEARAVAEQLQREQNLVFVAPFDDDAIIAGQGTIGLEMLEQVPELDVLVVPVGGGGLIAGIAIAAKAVKPSIEIVGVQSDHFPSMKNEFDQADLPTGGTTIAEGIAVGKAGERTAAITKQLVTDILLVDEIRLERAICMLLDIEKTVVEGAGAAGLAAMLTQPDWFRGKRVATLLTGGNIDPRLLASIILRELVREGRVATLRIEIPDRPGLLARIATLLGEAGANIVEVRHDRLTSQMSARTTGLDVMIESRDWAHTQAIRAVVEEAGYPTQILPGHR